MSEKTLRLVLDTSILISAFFWEGNEAELLRTIEQGKARLYLSKEILDELAEVVARPKFRQAIMIAKTSPEQILEKILSLSELVVPTIHITVCRDIKDNKFLECAETANADYIVSGDEDLLTLKEYNNIKILKTLEMLKLI